MQEEKEQQLKTTTDEIIKKFGKGSIMKMGQGSTSFDMGVISTGALPLDVALGVGGVPRGRIVEIYGPEASGKTTLGLQIVAEAQAQGGIAAYIDAEHALDPVYAAKLGVDVDNLLISQPDTGEQGLEICDMLVKSKSISVIVIDSVAALVPKSEIEGEMGEVGVGSLARLMSHALRKLTVSVADSNTTCIFINQLREKIGVMFGNPETTPGGRALKFCASVRLDIRRTEWIKDGSDAIGSRVRVKVVKNKVAPPFRQAEFDIVFGEGVSKEGCLLDMAVDSGICSKTGPWFSYKEEKIGQGREAAKETLRTNIKLRSDIEKAVRESYGLPAHKTAKIADKKKESKKEVKESTEASKK